METAKTGSISFGFSKKLTTKQLTKSSYGEKEEEENDKEVITGIEGNIIEGSRSKDEDKGPAVIPLVKKNRWVMPGKTLVQDLISQAEGNLETQAAQEILKDLRKHIECDEEDQDSSTVTVPLLMQNCVPRVEGLEYTEKLDIAMRPNSSSLDDYHQMPISSFGHAMLRGMGWSVGEGIGKTNKQVIKPVEFTPRFKGLGLGAERLVDLDDDKNKKKKIRKPGEEKDESEARTSDGFARGVYVFIVSGTHKNLYGKVDGIDGDNARIFVTLAINKQSVTVGQNCLKIVDEAEYKKHSRRLNNVEENQSIRNVRNGHDEKAFLKEKATSSKRKYDERDHDASTYRDYNKAMSSTSRSDHSNTSKRLTNDTGGKSWLRPKTRVRIISKTYKKGRYYNIKVNVIDVVRAGTCICKTDDGRLLEDITEDMLETIVPKGDPAYVLVVSGKYKDSVGKLLHRDKSNYKATILLLRDDEAVILDYDDICEYTGNVEYDD